MTLSTSRPRNTAHMNARRLFNAGFTAVPLAPAVPGDKETGKAPFGKWRHLQAPGVQTKESLDYAFNRAPINCGVGVILNDPLIAVLDFDKEPGGLDSLKHMESLVMRLDHGPTQITGGSGQHRWYRTRRPLKNGSDILRKVGFPGVDLRTKGGQVAVEGTVHYSGNLYEWLDGQAPWDTEIPLMPQEWEDLIVAQQFDARQDSQFSTGEAQGSTPSGHTPFTRDQLKELFTTIYITSQRHTALAQLVGTFKGRNICGPCTLDFFYDWQEDYFSPPFPVQPGNDETKNTILSLYENEDPKKFTKCRHQNEDHIRWLKDWTLPIKVAARAAQKDQSEAQGKGTDNDPEGPVKPAPVVDMKEESAAIRAKARSKNMFQAVKDFTTDNVISQTGVSDAPNEESIIWSEDKNTELATIRNSSQFGVSGTKNQFLVLDPEMAPHKDDLVEIQDTHTVLNEREAERLSSCGFVINMVCKQHGNQGCTHSSCKLPFHSACPSHMTYKLRQVDFPALEEGEYYREVWFTGRVLTEGTDAGKIADNIEEALTKFQAVVAKANGWKETRKLIMARSVSLRLERPVTTVIYRVMVKEEHVGQADRTLEKISKAINAIALASRRFQNPEDAAVQLMLNSMSSLNYLWDKNDMTLFEAYRLALRGTKAFQTMGVLWGLMKGAKKRELPLCPICGDPLDMILVRPETADNPLMQQNQPFRPTGTDPPWQ